MVIIVCQIKIQLKKLVIIKNGDHSLSDKNPIKKIIKELNKIVLNVI